MNRQRLILTSMTVTLCLITGFQVYWIYSSWQREKMWLGRLGSHVLRESVLECTLDSSVSKLFLREGNHGVDWNVVSMKESHTVTLDSDNIKKSETGVVAFVVPGSAAGGKRLPDRIPEIVVRRDSVITALDSGLVHEVDPARLQRQMAARLKAEEIPVDFNLIFNSSADSFPDHHSVLCTHPVPVSFESPRFVAAKFSGYTGLLIWRVLPQMMVSMVIIGISLFSFLLLYRNLRSQQKIASRQRQLISNISHELKTPIATVSVALEALRSFHKMNDPQKTEQYLSISQQELSRLALLADKVLRLSLLEDGQLHLQLETCDLRAIALETMDALRLQVENAGGKMTLDAPEGNYSLQGDPLHLSSVLFNLLDNAVKYSNGAPEVEFSLQATEETVTISVKDKGIGISKENQQKVFEKFFRVTQGDLHNVKGFGLGLSYVAEIVKRHHGKIRLESQPGTGSTFILTLPRKQNG